MICSYLEKLHLANNNYIRKSTKKRNITCKAAKLTICVSLNKWFKKYVISFGEKINTARL